MVDAADADQEVATFAPFYNSGFFGVNGDEENFVHIRFFKNFMEK